MNWIVIYYDYTEHLFTEGDWNLNFKRFSDKYDADQFALQQREDSFGRQVITADIYHDSKEVLT